MSLNILENIDLKQYNTFKVKANTKYLCLISTVEDLSLAVDFIKNKFESKWLDNILFLGAGSNLLFVNDFQGLIIKNNFRDDIKDITIVNQDDTSIVLNVGSGLEWDTFVKYCCQHKYYGIENLSHIPGTVGTSPVQNIGAYGVEVASLIESVEIYNCTNKSISFINNQDCLFSYRDSIFKDINNKSFFILSVNFRLSKIKSLKIDYKDILDFLNHNQLSVDSLDIMDLRNIIIDIRNNKLPDWRDIEALGSAGSFFKNPIVDQKALDFALSQHKDIIHYELFYKGQDMYKLSAGYIIDKVLNYKNYKLDQVGTYQNQALVIVNFGQAKGKDIIKFANMINKKSIELLNIPLETEVNII